MRIDVFLGDHVVDVSDLLDQRLRRAMMLLVVRFLNATTTLRLVNRLAHGVGDRIGIHHHMAVHITRRATDRLNKRAIRAQEAFLISVQDCH